MLEPAPFTYAPLLEPASPALELLRSGLSAGAAPAACFMDDPGSPWALSPAMRFGSTLQARLCAVRAAGLPVRPVGVER